MNTQTIIPDLILEAFLGTTPFVRASEQLPTLTGYYKTRRLDAPDLLVPQRRWFDGTRFSSPILPGMPDEEAKIRQATPTWPEIQEQLEWCGLLVLPPGIYYTEYKPRVVHPPQETGS